ncbi:hypothetical protein FGG08_004196 [Glutinoglossum americanum]|uniref:Inosine/uridine-preferring nucleoside hydrolase domain-containing protein n=1 Tax=Glutinoglossum americanum TaxID=1670608 RepID=A0A9P8L2S2_9PEZI|nr:hypothetical protein FGG08_004196 [Glutinoglossum americanum]
MGIKRSHDQISGEDSSLVHPSRQPLFSPSYLPPPPRKKIRTRIKKPKVKGPKASRSGPMPLHQVKKRVRDLGRLLKHAEDMPADVRMENERALGACSQELAARKAENSRLRLDKRYRQVKFFERQKATRRLKQLNARLSTTPPTEIASLQQQIHIAEVNLNYVLYYPPARRYVSLYPPVAKAGGSDSEHEVKAGDRNDIMQKGNRRVWEEIERRMASGTLEEDWGQETVRIAAVESPMDIDIETNKWKGKGERDGRSKATPDDSDGTSGLDGTTLLPPPLQPSQAQNAILAARDAILATGERTAWVVATGALTNIALLFATFPEVASWIKGLSIMGGAVGGGFTDAVLGRVDGELRVGNWTKWAEFNIYCDPESAQSLFSNPILAKKTTLIPLDLSHLVLATKPVLQNLLYGPSASPISNPSPSTLRCLLYDLLTFFATTYAQVFDLTAGPPLHDPIAVIAIIPAVIDDFRLDDRGGERFEVEVVTGKGELAGRIIVKDVGPGLNGVRIPRGVDVERFWVCYEDLSLGVPTEQIQSLQAGGNRMIPGIKHTQNPSSLGGEDKDDDDDDNNGVDDRRTSAAEETASAADATDCFAADTSFTNTSTPRKPTLEPGQPAPEPRSVGLRSPSRA